MRRGRIAVVGEKIVYGQEFNLYPNATINFKRKTNPSEVVLVVVSQCHQGNPEIDINNKLSGLMKSLVERIFHLSCFDVVFSVVLKNYCIRQKTTSLVYQLDKICFWFVYTLLSLLEQKVFTEKTTNVIVKPQDTVQKLIHLI